MRLGVVAELVGCVGGGLEEGVVRVLLRQSRDVTKLEPHKSSDDFSVLLFLHCNDGTRKDETVIMCFIYPHIKRREHHVSNALFK